MLDDPNAGLNETSVARGASHENPADLGDIMYLG